MRLRAAVIASAAAASFLASTACGTRTVAQPDLTCGWQCGPPYELVVTFRPGTTRPAAQAAMDKCRMRPIVIRIGQLQWTADTPPQLTATIFTRSKPAKAQPIPLVPSIPLLVCLRAARSVESVGWPD